MSAYDELVGRLEAPARWESFAETDGPGEIRADPFRAAAAIRALEGERETRDGVMADQSRRLDAWQAHAAEVEAARQSAEAKLEEIRRLAGLYHRNNGEAIIGKIRAAASLDQMEKAGG